ncbi:Hypothetical protein Tcol_1037 [Trichococcus collinsii]|uniref:Uncharacterized protein n=1 Tax=Trichococcus collinsii TaxID=157076 RepID=A0AB38A0P4_9LACT|nr:Hypothetical protein Tcol_1037 [Trichococcus collinsii]SEA52809.1 hypothetical protein SAMN04488525_103344 [Trichococcus collinsii]
MQGAPLNFPAESALEGYPEEICSWKPAKTVLAGKNAWARPTGLLILLIR